MRTAKLFGYSTTQSEIRVEFNGAVVFDGIIDKEGIGDVPSPIASFDIEKTLDGDIPTIISAKRGDIVIVALGANYFTWEGKVFPARNKWDIVNLYPWFHNGAIDSKKNVFVNGNDYMRGITTEDSGAWHVKLSEGDIMTCDFVVEATPIKKVPLIYR